MKVYSLRTLIDDILLIVRNNNISESEDLSRDLIRAWVLAYKAYLAKRELDKDEDDGSSDDYDDSMSLTIGPLELIPVEPYDKCTSTKRTKELIPDIMGNSDRDIINIIATNGCVIQSMSKSRRHYHLFRRYTFAEPSYRFEDGYIYIDEYGRSTLKDVNAIYVEGNFIEGDAEDEDDVIIPGWMIPDIKNMIIKNELAMMLGRPSDDSNNSTIASVKPHGPQDLQK